MGLLQEQIDAEREWQEQRDETGRRWREEDKAAVESFLHRNRRLFWGVVLWTWFVVTVSGALAMICLRSFMS